MKNLVKINQPTLKYGTEHVQTFKIAQSRQLSCVWYASVEITTIHHACVGTDKVSSKYEHRRASALLRNNQNIGICIGKKPIVSITYENEKISIKNNLPYLKCVLRLSCVVHGTIYGRFMGFYVNAFLCI